MIMVYRYLRVQNKCGTHDGLRVSEADVKIFILLTILQCEINHCYEVRITPAA
jgi:hypothetical protein